MKSHLVMAAALALFGTACSGGAGGNGANTAEGNAAGGNAASGAAGFDPNSEQGRAYRAAVECAGTIAAAKSIVGGVSMSKTGAEQEAYRAEEERRRVQARAMTAYATQLGTALGLSASEVERAISAHEGTFVQTSASGSMDQFGATVGAQANQCIASFPQVPGLTAS